jgi:hypothetical protein
VAPRDGHRALLRFLVIAGFLFLLNMFTNADGGRFELWFQWPVLVIAFVMALRWTRARR